VVASGAEALAAQGALRRAQAAAAPPPPEPLRQHPPADGAEQSDEGTPQRDCWCDFMVITETLLNLLQALGPLREAHY
jgi:hypothetical protein